MPLRSDRRSDCGKVVETLSNAFAAASRAAMASDSFGNQGLPLVSEPAYPPGSLGGDRGSFVGGAPISRVPLRCQFRVASRQVVVSGQ